MPRHRTMQAVVDWSYGLLSQDEQRSFRALGIFAGGFTGEAAAAIAMDAATTDADAIDRLADLVAKSLVVAQYNGTNPRFRLLDTTRAFALEKLDASGEREAIAYRHAEYYRQLFARAEAEAPARPTGDWLADYAQEIDNLRAALGRRPGSSSRTTGCRATTRPRPRDALSEARRGRSPRPRTLARARRGRRTPSAAPGAVHPRRAGGRAWPAARSDGCGRARSLGLVAQARRDPADLSGLAREATGLRLVLRNSHAREE